MHIVADTIGRAQECVYGKIYGDHSLLGKNALKKILGLEAPLRQFCLMFENIQDKHTAAGAVRVDVCDVILEDVNSV